jgi:methyl-accepting chemotaxis protein
MSQLRAHFGTIEQLQSDQAAHAGTIEQYRQALRQAASQALNTLDGGIGADEHAACMRQVDRLIDEHINATQSFHRSTQEVSDTFRQGANNARNILASGS